jgi:hypothetical protein
MLRPTIVGSLFFGAVGAVLAQVAAPQLGWIPDGGGIRPVYGMAAAAAVGPAVPSSQAFAHVAAPPSRNYVLVSAADTGIVSIYQPGKDLDALDGAGIAPDSIVVSPRGAAAALWFSSINQVQIVTGLPDAPVIRQLDVSFLAGAPAALAVTDDGAWVAGAWPAGAYAFGPQGDANRLPIEDGATVLAFFSESHDLAIANAAGLQMVTGLGAFAIVSTLTPFADSSPPAVAVAVTADNLTVLAVDRGGFITAVRIGAGTGVTVDCACQPEGLFAMGPSSFRLTGLQDGAFKLFDAALGEVLFAPVALSPGADGAGQ